MDAFHDLRVLLMKQQVNRVASTCFYHLRHLRQIKPYINIDAKKHFVTAVILGRLLQLCVCRSAVVNNRSTAMGSERCSATCPQLVTT